MKYIKKSSENEMIVVFLRAEIDSKRFGSNVAREFTQLNVSRKLIDRPNLIDNQENALRRKILANYRGYGRNTALFNNFPQVVEWDWVEFSQEDLKKIMYMNYDYWNGLSGGSRLPRDAVRNILNGVEIFNQSNKRFFEAVEALKNEQKFPPIIVVSSSKEGNIVVLEGHLRLTAYMLEPQAVSQYTKMIIGNSPDFNKWVFY